MKEQLRLGSSDESTLQASKWLKIPVLIDDNEMATLFDVLGDFSLFHCGVVHSAGQGSIDKNEFLTRYKTYVDYLSQGKLPPAASYQQLFSCVMTTTSSCLFAIPVGKGQELIRISKPVIQIQAHTFHYSPIDKKFRSMVFGSDTIVWGIQFSYPQLFLDPVTRDVETTKKSTDSPNSQLFHSLQKWIRQHTIPTPFVVDGVVHKSPIRLGKQCLKWINRHPQLEAKGIGIRVEAGSQWPEEGR